MKRNMQTKGATQLTVRGLSPGTVERLRDEARRHGWSVNRTAVHLLEAALGGEDAAPVRHDLSYLFGSWTEEEFLEFDRFLKESRTPDPRDWE